MGILDKVFSGPKGVVSILAGKLGGSATIIYLIKGLYDKETDLYGDSEIQKTVKFIPVSWTDQVKSSFVSTAGGFSMSGGLQRENFDLAGTISASELETVPEPNKDKIQYDGKVFLIASIKANYVGDVPVSYFLTAKV